MRREAQGTPGFSRLGSTAESQGLARVLSLVSSGGHSMPRAGTCRSLWPAAPAGECVRAGGAPGPRVPAVVRSVGLDAAALGALVHHLAGLQL